MNKLSGSSDLDDALSRIRRIPVGQTSVSGMARNIFGSAQAWRRSLARPLRLSSSDKPATSRNILHNNWDLKETPSAADNVKGANNILNVKNGQLKKSEDITMNKLIPKTADTVQDRLDSLRNLPEGIDLNSIARSGNIGTSRVDLQGKKKTHHPTQAIKGANKLIVKSAEVNGIDDGVGYANKLIVRKTSR